MDEAKPYIADEIFPMRPPDGLGPLVRIHVQSDHFGPPNRGEEYDDREAMDYRVERRNDVWVLVDPVGCRPASDAEVAMWGEIERLKLDRSAESYDWEEE